MSFDLSTVSTADLQTELSRREGVSTFVLVPDDNIEIAIKRPGANIYADIDGPVTITINVD